MPGGKAMVQIAHRAIRRPAKVRGRAPAPNMPAWVMQRLLPLHKYLVAPPIDIMRGIGYNIGIKKIKLVWEADDSLSWQ